MRDQLPMLLDRWRAFGAFVGHRHRHGRRRRELCLVVMTAAKETPARGSGISRVPRHVRWRDGRCALDLPTDVVEVPAEFTQQLGTVFGPGDVSAANGEAASIGAVVRRGRAGLWLTTAGHLFQSGVPAVAQVRSGNSRIDCRVVEVQQRNSVDYALLQPTTAVQLDNLFRDQVRIGPVYTPGPQDLYRSLFLLHGDGGLRRTRCTGINGQFNGPQGVYRNLILTDAMSEDGHSGGALVDSSNRLWGFLLGRFGNRFSFYVQAQIVFDVAGVTLFQG